MPSCPVLQWSLSPTYSRTSKLKKKLYHNYSWAWTISKVYGYPTFHLCSRLFYFFSKWVGYPTHEILGYRDKTSTDRTSTDKTSTDKTSTGQKVYVTKGLWDKMSTGTKGLQGQNIYGTKGLLGIKGLQKCQLGKKVYWEKMYKI